MDDIKIGPILPLSLQRRIKRIIKIHDILNEDRSTTTEQNPLTLEKNDTISVDNNQICIEPKSKPKPLFEVKTNWISEYCKRAPKERVIWDTKLYSKWKQFDQKSLFEQTEELLDNSAEDFVKCINKLITDNEELKINKEMIKKLFSIEAERDVARSLYVQTIHRPVVPSELAELFECPERCIELNVRRLLDENRKSFNIKPKYHAFGRCLSPTSKRELRLKYKETEPLNFPEDIRTGENLFRGIEQLKSVKMLLKHLDEHNLSKPEYLVKMNALNSKSNNSLRHTPLYTFYQ